VAVVGLGERRAAAVSTGRHSRCPSPTRDTVSGRLPCRPLGDPGRTRPGVLRHQQARGLRALLDDAERARRDRLDRRPEAGARARAHRRGLARVQGLAGGGALPHRAHDAPGAPRGAPDVRRAGAARNRRLSMPAALDHLHVLEVGSGVGAAYAAKLLADLGASVIKIEPPGEGDATRARGPFPGNVPHPEKSGLFLYLNANKRGITSISPGRAGARSSSASRPARTLWGTNCTRAGWRGAG